MSDMLKQNTCDARLPIMWSLIIRLDICRLSPHERDSTSSLETSEAFKQGLGKRWLFG